MCKNQKSDVRLEVAQNIQEYLESFHSVSELYERAAKATACLMHAGSKMCHEDKERIDDMVQDYICILDLLEPFKKGE